HEQNRAHHGEEELGIDVAGRGRVEVLGCALGDLGDGGGAAGAGAEVDGAAEGGGVEGEPRDRGGDIIDGHDVQHGVGIAGHGAPQAARVDLERPVHHFEAGGGAGAGVAHNDAGPENDAGQRTQVGAHQRFRLGLGLLVGVAVALADGEFVFAHEVGALACDVGRADVGQAAELRRSSGEVQHAAGTFDVDAASFVQRVVEADGGGGGDKAGGLRGEALVRCVL